MASIPDSDKAKARFYLGYVGESIPWGDQALLTKALARTDYDATIVTLISGQVTRCADAWTEIAVPAGELAYNRNITGDVNRTDQELRSRDRRKRERDFVKESDQLALTLGVRNYRNPENLQFVHYGLPNP
jgi:hypothetical protein